eukprot:CAMPEP_0119533766 /NCGR_PEP_ID=MMETSP1344-20130328/47099_1 /TAXON_ID=236787 /ORGANISM="Florenciella parvula, Strain CCMP2471" /LENGTH=261 /DNA_ID=CAMNT_0007574771 /DNA_START=119 /DNA_END=903 /DNA_ORIENTATION=+
MNREEALAAARRNGDVLMTEGKHFDADLEIVLAAVQSSVDALLWADPALREDKQVLLAACAANGRALRYTKALRSDKDVALVAVENDGDSLQFADRLRGDRDVVLAACAQTGWALQYASEELRDDEEVVAVAVEQDPKALRCASDRLRNRPSAGKGRERPAAGISSKGSGSGGKFGDGHDVTGALPRTRQGSAATAASLAPFANIDPWMKATMLPTELLRATLLKKPHFDRSVDRSVGRAIHGAWIGARYVDNEGRAPGAA